MEGWQRGTSQTLRRWVSLSSGLSLFPSQHDQFATSFLYFGLQPLNPFAEAGLGGGAGAGVFFLPSHAMFAATCSLATCPTNIRSICVSLCWIKPYNCLTLLLGQD